MAFGQSFVFIQYMLIILFDVIELLSKVQKNESKNRFSIYIDQIKSIQYYQMRNNPFQEKRSTMSQPNGQNQNQVLNLNQQSIQFPPSHLGFNINTHILFMNKIVQNRINRSLAIHGLENLVFEKRQRKSIDPIPAVIPKNIHQSNISKKKEISIQRENPQINTIQTNRKKNYTSPPKHIAFNNSIMKKKQIKKKLKRQEEDELVEQQAQQIPIDPVKQENIASQVRKGAVRVKKNNQNKGINIKKESAQQNNNREATKLLNKRGRGRPKKDISKQGVLVQQQPQPQQQSLIVQIPPFQPQALIKKEMSIEQPSEQKESQQKINNRERKAKMNPYKNYNENQDNHFSQESQIGQKEYKKKKRISKVYRSKNGNKPYSLNRIFRKQAKRHFQTFTLDANLNKVSLPYFIKQFGVFDLVHFSLPISYLNQFPEIGSMIQKGFIFVWAEQGQTQIGYHLLNRWGFDVIDQIIWIKSNQDDHKIQADNVDICNSIDTNQDNQKQKQLFVNCKSTCLVGYKCPLGNKAQYRTKVSNNIIFAKSLDGIKKPSEIYQIADLMMPGAKKLQFGGDAQKGWLNIKHYQTTLFRCNSCLRQQNLFLLPSQQGHPIQCKRCIVNKLKSNAETQLIDQIAKQYRKLAKIKISQICYQNTQQDIICTGCHISSEQLQCQGIVLSAKRQKLCIKCFKAQETIKSTEEIKVIIKKKKTYLKSQLSCSDCGVLSICDIYFECCKCKNHIICKNCFWKNKLQNESNNDGVEQQVKKSAKKEIMHEWKLKFIKNHPLMKFACFGCKDELSIPFWCCQTCQNWSWCGKCNRGKSEIHPHYQSNNHIQYIMI